VTDALRASSEAVCRFWSKRLLPFMTQSYGGALNLRTRMCDRSICYTAIPNAPCAFGLIC
jgi:hypothetical protein